jgi:hypothetical protein
MTTQKKQFISLDDILSLVLDCEWGGRKWVLQLGSSEGFRWYATIVGVASCRLRTPQEGNWKG